MFAMVYRLLQNVKRTKCHLNNVNLFLKIFLIFWGSPPPQIHYCADENPTPVPAPNHMLRVHTVMLGKTPPESHMFSTFFVTIVHEFLISEIFNYYYQ